jgi:glycosyltransferase involved in cell wall biosynthesis
MRPPADGGREPNARSARSTAKSQRRRVSAVIPAKNEARNIGWVIERIPLLVDEVVLVDGISTDQTIDVALALRPDVVVVKDHRRGKGVALRAGFEAATGDYVVMLDADGSMDPLEIPRFVELLDQGADLVKGSRFIQGGGTADMSPLRDVGNRGLLSIANVLFNASHTDLCYGYAAFRRQAILELGLTAVGFEIETQLFLRAIRHGLSVVEVPSFESPRRSGTSNLHTFRDGWRVLRTIVDERVSRDGSAPLSRRDGYVDGIEVFSGEPSAPARFPGGAGAAVPVETVVE